MARRSRALAFAVSLLGALGCGADLPPSSSQPLVGTETEPWTPAEFPRAGWFDFSFDEDRIDVVYNVGAALVAMRPDGRYGVVIGVRHSQLTPAGQFWDTWPFFRPSGYPGDNFHLPALGGGVPGGPPHHALIDRRFFPDASDLVMGLFRTDAAWLASQPDGMPETLRTTTLFPATYPEGGEILASVADYWHQGAVYGFDPMESRKVRVQLLTEPWALPALAELFGYANQPANDRYNALDAAGDVVGCTTDDPESATLDPACTLGGDSGSGIWSADGTALYGLHRNKIVLPDAFGGVHTGANAIGRYPEHLVTIQKYVDTFVNVGAVQVTAVGRATASVAPGTTLTFYAVSPRRKAKLLAMNEEGESQSQGSGVAPGSLLAVFGRGAAIPAPFHVVIDYVDAAGAPHPLRVSFPSVDLGSATRQASLWIDAFGSTYWADDAHTGIGDGEAELMAPLDAIPEHLAERAETQAELEGVVTVDGKATTGVEVSAFPAGASVDASSVPVAISVTSGGGQGSKGSYRLSLPIEQGYGAVDTASGAAAAESESYDLYLRAPGQKTRTLAALRVVAGKTRSPVDLKLGAATIYFFPRYLALGPYTNEWGCGPPPDIMRLDRLCDGTTSEASILPEEGMVLGPPAASCAAGDSTFVGAGNPTIVRATTPKTTLDFNQVWFGRPDDPIENLATYAWVYVRSLAAEPRSYVLGVASDDAIRVTQRALPSGELNELATLVYCRGSQTAGDIQNHVPITLQPGWNLIGFEVFEGGFGWNMRARLEDADGRPLTTEQIQLSP